MNCPLLVLGTGGHARVLLDALFLRGCTVLGMVGPDSQRHGTSIMGITVLGSDAVVYEYSPAEVELVNGLGSIGSMAARRELFTRFSASGYRFAQVIHPSAIVARDVVLGEGVQLAAGSIVQTAARIGENTLINTRASVDHDCVIGAHVHIAPGCTLSGGVQVGDSVHIGCGATIREGVCLGEGCLVAAGAVVVAEVAPRSRVAGIPAKALI